MGYYSFTSQSSLRCTFWLVPKLSTHHSTTTDYWPTVTNRVTFSITIDYRLGCARCIACSIAWRQRWRWAFSIGAVLLGWESSPRAWLFCEQTTLVSQTGRECQGSGAPRMGDTDTWQKWRVATQPEIFEIDQRSNCSGKANVRLPTEGQHSFVCIDTLWVDYCCKSKWLGSAGETTCNRKSCPSTICSRLLLRISALMQSAKYSFRQCHAMPSVNWTVSQFSVNS